ncbi:MAG: EpsD family peptidyl-prolyl cis-trans isomerase [Betaproteobacteria bacterium]
MTALRAKRKYNVRGRYFWLAGGMMAVSIAGYGLDSHYEAQRQVAATVNGQIISLRELNDKAGAIEGRSTLTGINAKQLAIDALVNEELLAQMAIEGGLDRAPETRIALDRMKRRVLALAAIDHAMDGRTVNQREIKTFFDNHPDLFERRKTYVFQRFDVFADRLPASVRTALEKADSPGEVGSVLSHAKIKFGEQTEIRTAEMMPGDVLRQAALMRRGDILIFSEAKQPLLLQLVGEIREPMDLARAAPPIRSHLLDGKKKRTARKVLGELRASAKIEYPTPINDPQAPGEPADHLASPSRGFEEITPATIIYESR